MIDCKENEDGSFTISWDSEDPEESIFNDWTEEDFTNAITDYLNALKESGVLDDDGEQKLTESVEQVTEYFIDQTPEEVQQDIINAQEFVRQDEEDERLPRLFF